MSGARDEKAVGRCHNKRVNLQVIMLGRALTRGGMPRAPREARSLRDKMGKGFPFLVRRETFEVGDMGPRAVGLGAEMIPSHERHAKALGGLGPRTSISNRAKGKLFGPSSKGVEDKHARCLGLGDTVRI